MMETTTESTTNNERGLLGYVVLALKGFCMGSADVVPGVSGGTMALITGIYEELIQSIRVVGQPEFIGAVLRFRIGEIFSLLNWKFLVALFAGIALAVITLAPGIEWMLDNQPVLLWSFFFGLLAASVILVGKRISRWTPLLYVALAVGAIFAYWLVGLVPRQTPETWWFLILSGAVAICAMILPGISGSFILVLMGKYEFFIGAINGRDIVSIALAGIGAVVGLVTFAQVLGWLFKRYHDLTIALLTGLMIGSLRKVWPWKIVENCQIDRHGDVVPLVERNILPSFSTDSLFTLATNNIPPELASTCRDPNLLMIDGFGPALGLALVGFVAVVIIERLGSRTA